MGSVLRQWLPAGGLWGYVRKTNTAFLCGTFLATMVGVPAYIWHFGLSGFQVGLFAFFLVSTGLSITLGYHRLFSHLTFQAKWPIKLYTLLFGAAAFEGSALAWSADHRRHHKFVDHEDDPYDISRGLFHAHIGWLLFRTGPETPLTWVRDLQKDRLAWWQHRFYPLVAVAVGFGLPTLAGWLWEGPIGALGGFLMAGAARIVVVHHMTFCINSLCHWIGKRPYSSRCTARDSFLMAIFTFGEGYHNFHHEFQYDYRNGIGTWKWDPTKWTIWTLEKLDLASQLRKIPEEKILKAQIAEHERLLEAKLGSVPTAIPEPLGDILEAARARVRTALAEWESLLQQYRASAEVRSKERREIKRRLRDSANNLRKSLKMWLATGRSISDQLPTA